MNKKLLSYLLTLIVLFLGAMYYSNTIQSPIISSLNSIKSIYHATTKQISDAVDRYFLQVSTIKELKERLENYEKNHLVMQQLASEIHDLYEANKSAFALKPEVSLVRALSYQEFGNFNRLWLEVEDYNDSKIYGLTYKELVAGIVISKNSKPLALLNKDIKSSYAVYVGETNVPGIAHGNNDANLVVNFIPSWFAIEVGDEVVSSGLDEIFFKGLKVGRVISISKTQGYQNAIVEPYYKAEETHYFHMIREIR